MSESFRASAGIRIGGNFDFGSGIVSPFAGVRAIQEFNGDLHSRFVLGSVILLDQQAPGTWGEASAGLTFTTGAFEAFLRGELEFGGEIEGHTARAGIRLRF